MKLKKVNIYKCFQRINPLLYLILFLVVTVSFSHADSSQNNQLTNEILKRAYKKAYGNNICAFYSVKAKAYFDGRKLVEFDHEIQTLAVTVPPWLGYKINLKQSISEALEIVSIAGVKIYEYKIAKVSQFLKYFRFGRPVLRYIFFRNTKYWHGI